MKTTIVGIDPGSRVGVAVLNRRGNGTMGDPHCWTLDRCATYDMAELNLFLVLEDCASIHSDIIAVIEQPAAGIFPRAGQSARAMLKIARNVGQCAARADEIRRKFEALGIQCVMSPPIRGGTKRAIPETVWRTMFQWQVRSPSNHARDSACLARRYAQNEELKNKMN